MGQELMLTHQETWSCLAEVHLWGLDACCMILLKRCLISWQYQHIQCQEQSCFCVCSGSLSGPPYTGGIMQSARWQQSHSDICWIVYKLQKLCESVAFEQTGSSQFLTVEYINLRVWAEHEASSYVKHINKIACLHWNPSISTWVWLWLLVKRPPKQLFINHLQPEALRENILD